MRPIAILFIIAAILAVTCCKHSPEPAPACIAGSGGEVMIVTYATFNGITIPNYTTHPDTAFVKFGTTLYPGPAPSNYNVVFIGEPGEDHIHIAGLKCGDYYIYRTAWDSIANVSRYGGYGISFSDTTGMKTVTIIVN